MYTEQQKKRLSWMPWLYASLKPKLKVWVDEWQASIQAELMAMETISIGQRVFIAPDAAIFAEPNRDIIIGDDCTIAAGCFIHGPVVLAEHVSINHHSSLDGGQRGIRIGHHTRIAHDCSLYAFNHQTDKTRLIRQQPVHSQGITLGSDVWLGARVGVVDGIDIGDGAVVGMGSVVTHNVQPGQKVAGVPAKAIGWR